MFMTLSTLLETLGVMLSTVFGYLIYRMTFCFFSRKQGCLLLLLTFADQANSPPQILSRSNNQSQHYAQKYVYQVLVGYQNYDCVRESKHF